MGVSCWWFLKTLSSLGLIVYTCFALLEEFICPRFFLFPLEWAQFLVCCGAFLSIWHYFLLKREAKSFGSPAQLVTQKGLFHWIRHPMYLGDLFVFLGFFLMGGEGIGLILLAVGWISIFFQCRIEDRLMAQHFGEAHQQWQAQTALLLPFMY
jgi:protein-S-isoprenylcysteine O-methyltransferase Ste14